MMTMTKMNLNHGDGEEEREEEPGEKLPDENRQFLTPSIM